MMEKKRGRPRADKVWTDRIDLRLSDEEVSMLKQLSYEMDISKSEIIRRAIKMMYYSKKR